MNVYFEFLDEAEVETVYCYYCGEPHSPQDMHGSVCSNCAITTLEEQMKIIDEAVIAKIEAEAKVAEMLNRMELGDLW